MKKLLAMLRIRSGHAPDVVALSAYADGRLAANEAAALEAHVASCDACRERLAGLREVRSALAALPEAEAPRSFRLRQADVERTPASEPLLNAPWMRAMPVLATAAAAVFVAAVVMDAGGGSSESPSSALTADRVAERNASAPQPSTAGGAQAYDSAGTPPDAGTFAPLGPQGDSAGGESAPGPATGVDAPKATEATSRALVPSPEVQAAGDAAQPLADDGDDGISAVRMTEIIAGALALVAAAVAVAAWRQRRVR